MTNVKPGDLAMIVKATAGYQWTLGRPVEIASACCFADKCAAWQFVHPLRNGSVSVRCAPDAFLKRIEPLTDKQAREARADLHQKVDA